MILSQISIVKKPKRLKPKVYILRLSNIVKHLKNLKFSSNFLKSFSRDLKRQSSIVKIIKNFDSDLNTGVSLLKNNLLKHNSVNYIINITLSPTNTFVNILSVEGKPIMAFSSGSVKLTKRQKKVQPLALLSLLKLVFVKAKFLNNQPVSLHFKNVKSFYESMLIKLLKTKVLIKSINSYDMTPHNGCRPKKIRRVKRRTKRMVLR